MLLRSFLRSPFGRFFSFGGGRHDAIPFNIENWKDGNPAVNLQRNVFPLIQFLVHRATGRTIHEFSFERDDKFIENN